MKHEYNPWEGSYKVQATKIHKARAKIEQRKAEYEVILNANKDDTTLVWLIGRFLSDMKKIDNLLMKGEE